MTRRSDPDASKMTRPDIDDTSEPAVPRGGVRVQLPLYSSWWQDEHACLGTLRQFMFTYLSLNAESNKYVFLAAAKTLSVHPTGALSAEGLALARDVWGGLRTCDTLLPAHFGVKWVQDLTVQQMAANKLFDEFMHQISLYARVEMFVYLVLMGKIAKGRVLWETPRYGLRHSQKAREVWLVWLVDSGCVDEARVVSCCVGLPITCLDIETKMRFWQEHNPRAASAWAAIVRGMADHADEDEDADENADEDEDEGDGYSSESSTNS